MSPTDPESPSKTPSSITCSAVLSPCRLYRYELRRQWDPTKPEVAFIGLNPSTADETQDDPTIRKCIGYAKRWGFGGLCMVNLFAYRATDPADMKRYSDPIGPENDETLRRITSSAGLTIAAWGTEGVHLDRAKAVLPLLHNPHCLRITKAGHPGHPLYILGSATPFPFLP